MESIAILVSTLGSGGAEKQAALLAQVLSKKYDVHFVALYGDSETSAYVISILENANVSVYPLSGNLLSKLRTFSILLKRNNVICAFNYLTKPNFWGSIIEKCSGIKWVYNGIRNTDLDGYKNILEWFSHNIIATGTIFNCYSGEEAFKKRGLRASKCITIPNCYPQISEPLTREQGKVVRIITVGRFHPQKDYETAIKTISILKRNKPDFIFLLCGYGVLEEQIRQWVKIYDVSDMVEFHIKPNDIPELLRSADIYLSTSLFEGTSNSIMEAMNWSLPIVATNVGDNFKLVSDNFNGFLTKVGDAEFLANRIAYLMDNPSTRVKYGINSNIKLREEFSIDLFEERYFTLLEKE